MFEEVQVEKKPSTDCYKSISSDNSLEFQVDPAVQGHQWVQ